MELIGIGSDHAGFKLKASLVTHIQQLGYEVIDFGTTSEESVDYPDYAQKVAAALLQGEIGRGILLCGSGIGVDIAANRHKGIRAALVFNESVATSARTHNDANILVLPAKHIEKHQAELFVKIFLETKFSHEERHERRVRKLDQV